MSGSHPVVQSPLTASATLDVAVTPVGSQQLVVIFGALSGLSVAAFFYFVWFSHPLLWIPGATAACLTSVTVWAHGRSRRWLDLSAAKQTRVISDGARTSVVTNATTLADPDAAGALERLISNLVHRQPLPVPDGIVSSQFAVDMSEDAKAEARDRVLVANKQAEEIAQRAVTEITGRGTSLQQPAISAPLTAN
jgi:hypothetical protein